MDSKPIQEIASQAFACPEDGRAEYVQQAINSVAPVAERLQWLRAVVVELERLERMKQLPAGDAPAANEACASGAGSGSARAVPEWVGDYMVLGELGHGGMGTVYKGRHRDLTNKEGVVALKTLAPGLSQDDSSLRRFKQEIDLLAQLQNPNIVRPIAVIRGNNGDNWLAMEYVDGVDLQKKVERSGPLPVREACQLILHATEALQYLHEQKVVHRDIKPSNLILSKSGSLKLADLGLARELGDQTGGLTRSGFAVGTLDYMAPEQAGDPKDVGHAADIYSLGCTLYFLLAGQAPYGDVNTLSGKLLGHRESPLPDVRERRKRANVSEPVPRAVLKILNKATAKSPADRYPTAASFGDDLRRCLAKKRRTSKLAWLLLFLVAALTTAAFCYPDIRQKVVNEVVTFAKRFVPPPPPPPPTSPVWLTGCLKAAHEYLLDEEKVPDPSLVRFVVIPQYLVSGADAAEKQARYIKALKAVLGGNNASSDSFLRVIGPNRTVVAVHLDSELCVRGGLEWGEVLNSYPYAVDHSHTENANLARLDSMVRALTGREGAEVRLSLTSLRPEHPQWKKALDAASKERCPMVRADWLVASMASKAFVESERQAVTAVRHEYENTALDLRRAASELNVADIRPQVSDREIRDALCEMGPLKPLVDGQTIGREAFAKSYPEIVLRLKLGDHMSFRSSRPAASMH